MEIAGVAGLPEIGPGDDLAALIAGATDVVDGDVLVVTSKIVSKAEGRTVELDDVTPSGFATEWATKWDKDPRVVELVLRESRRIVRMVGPVLITETRHGFVCANSGVDLSNVERGYAALLPLDSDRSARRIRDIIRARLGVTVGVIVSDTFGRVWRRGLTDVAIGVAGVAGVVDLRGTADALGRTMNVTEVAVADELAGAAELVMGKSTGIPVAVVRGVDPAWLRDAAVAELIRPPAEDLFR
jgi:coenzyme F420-0:L-glutamate ligase/coenzyme F420-1:gamma-L-glutamate ligase